MKRQPPKFWLHPTRSPAARLLRPFSVVATFLTRRRLKRPMFHASVPVLCCGNITTGGTGKTPLALDLVQRLRDRGYHPHILSRGHRGRQRGPVAVTPGQSTARDVGDEPLLLAQAAPTWIGADRAQTARLAISHGADCLIMDDGFQNPTLHKDVSILVVDGPSGFGNACVLPAGPLREPLSDALLRAQAVVVIGDDRHNLLPAFPSKLLTLQAKLVPGPEIRALQGRRVVAFAGIGRPEKFFDMLRDAGVDPVRALPFPDHHFYTSRDIQRLETLSRESGTTLVTTAKDAVKLPFPFRTQVRVIGVELLWADPRSPERLLDLLFRTV
ncbi:tetraacyldisaccharide 4'-kinase [Gluconobacter kanchanaburiensis]|uniref:Tetraacyldisaccharide 4'-kinase n=1 Tax=Gluconobacter kanchanaburiensis NBRC 103587 TaxID=1307948 RepID=A0A511B8V5_9PROT|nr:tetraacyldisaccharide 4'-kinase [Gluconobacter kanchanaburiensis]MBF0860628.1 tetraacyldisaccharide 4'-kinase [Gluconobacter kanchanaburiensis]GBR69497.1 tetraacyldisaccharide 4'-kinase [Gluconobacter kanchanaburiensis NBRC 103587]GEK96113.1 tetraacyldisaccharide 4'-kinase [Gluconobacter kanchanaburiensis NBRC 103587]